MNGVAVVVFVLASGLALVGLGRRAGARNVPVAWVVGWTVLWWPVAVVAGAIGSRWGAFTGLLLLAVGTIFWIRSSQARLRELGIAATATVAGAPFFLAPPYFYDALVYHLGLPWSWLINGSFAPAPHNLFSHFPLAGQTVYVIPMALGLDRAPAGLHWLTFCVALVALWELAGRLGAGRWAVVAPLLLASVWHALWVAGVAGVDHLVLAGILVAAAELLAGEPEAEPGRLPATVAGGLALGLTMSAKYVAAVPVLAVLGGLVLIRPCRWRQALGASAVAAAAGSFWYVRNWWTTGNPVYPLLWKYLGGRGWTVRDDVRFNALVHEGVHGVRSWLGGVSMLASEGPGLGLWLVLAALLAVVAVIRAGDREGPRRVTVAAGLMVAGWLMTSHTTRYAIPFAGLAAALAAAGVAAMDRRVRRLCVAAIGIAAAHGFLLFGGFVLGTLHLPALWTGSVTPDTWRHRMTLNDPVPGYRAADRLMPPGAGLLIVGEGRPWSCRRRFNISSPYETQYVQLLVEASPSAGTVADRLVAGGWRFLLINWGEIERLTPHYGMLQLRSARDKQVWRELLHRYTQRIWASGGVEIRRLVPGRPPAAPVLVGRGE